MSDSLVSFLKEHLRYDGEGCLLTINAQARQELIGQLRDLARRQLDRLALPWREKAQVENNPVLLPEQGLQQQGLYAEAITLYALEHDRLLDSKGKMAKVVRAMLRFKVAHTLDPDVGGLKIGTVHQQIELIEAVAKEAMECYNDGFLRDRTRRLLCDIFEHLGFLYGGLNSYKNAAKAYESASSYADDPARVLNTMSMAADATAEDGDKQTALRMVESVRYLVDETADSEASKMWGLIYGNIYSQLGGQFLREKHFPKREPLKTLAAIERSWLKTDIPPAREEIDKLLRQFHEEAKDPETPDDAELQATMVSGLLYLVSPVDDPRQWEGLLEKWEALKPHLGDKGRKIQLEIDVLIARRETATDPAGAVTLFEKLWPDVTTYYLRDSEKQLSIMGAYLEALGKAFSEEMSARIFFLVERVTTCCRDLLLSQPTSMARRRVRDVSQRTIEGAIMALLAISKESGRGSDRQNALRCIWRLLMEVRNPELRFVNTGQHVEDTYYHQLDTNFHAELCEALRALRLDRALSAKTDLDAEKDPREHRWLKPLQTLLDYEVAHLRQSANQDPSGARLPERGTAIAFFQFRDTSATKPLLGLLCRNGEFDFYFASEAKTVFDLLNTWSTSGYSLEASGLSAVLFPFLSTRPLADDAWYLLLDGRLNKFPIELLPDPRTHKPIAVSRPIYVVLRDVISKDCRIHFSRGWLALGGAPGVGEGNAELPGTITEIELIEEFLRRYGHPTKVLLGADAHFGNLCHGLDVMRPAVLHLAAHGVVNEHYPEACSMVLAKNPRGVEGEFLPFRRIRELDLSGIQLVVLSACSSSIGPSSRNADIEGLAWAFLQAGAEQVIASRHEVNDEKAAQFMDRLYRYLADYAPAKALQYAKSDMLDDGIERREAGTWALWT